MIYTGNKIRVSARIPLQAVQFIRDNNLVLNRFVNAALESFFYDVDHNLLSALTIEHLKDSKTKNTAMAETQAVQLRIEKMFYDKMELEGFVRNRTIVASVNSYILRYTRKEIAEWKLNEIRKAL